MGERAVVFKYLPEITCIDSSVASRAAHETIGFVFSRTIDPLIDALLPRNYFELGRHLTHSSTALLPGSTKTMSVAWRQL
jgi:hypothetical protein